MIDKIHLGYTTAPTKARAEAWRVKLFCEAIGEADSVYWDRAAAQSAGLPACPVPPTFLKAMESEHCSSAALLQHLNVPVRKVLHAEQSFEHFMPVYVGDEVEMSRTISDLYDKRGDALSFIVVRTRYKVRNQVACESTQTILVRNEPVPDAGEACAT